MSKWHIFVETSTSSCFISRPRHVVGWSCECSIKMRRGKWNLTLFHCSRLPPSMCSHHQGYIICGLDRLHSMCVECQKGKGILIILIEILILSRYPLSDKNVGIVLGPRLYLSVHYKLYILQTWYMSGFGILYSVSSCHVTQKIWILHCTEEF